MLAFLDHRPLFPGHCLVIPREHHETLPDLPAELLEPLFGAARLLAQARWRRRWTPRAPSWPSTTSSARASRTFTCTSCRGGARTACVASSGPATRTGTMPMRRRSRGAAPGGGAPLGLTLWKAPHRAAKHTAGTTTETEDHGGRAGTSGVQGDGERRELLAPEPAVAEGRAGRRDDPGEARRDGRLPGRGEVRARRHRRHGAPDEEGGDG